MPNSPQASPSIEGALAFIASSDDTTAGLRALAQEVGGRRGRRYRSLAERIERGERPSSLGRSETLSPESANAEAHSANLNSVTEVAMPSSVARLTRFAILERSRSTVRHQVIVVSALGCVYLLFSLAVGWFILQSTLPFATEFMEDLGVDQEARIANIASIHFFAGFYIAAIIALMVAALLLVVRLVPRSPAWVEWLWDHAPMIGPTLRARELAEMSESLYQSLLGGQSYSSAFGIASETTTSTRLRRWLIESKGRCETGESLVTIANDMPGRGEFIGGILGTLASAPTAAAVVDLWRETSVRMHGMMRLRGQRLRTVLAPAFVVMSLLIASFALIRALGTLYQVIEFIHDSLYWY